MGPVPPKLIVVERGAELGLDDEVQVRGRDAGIGTAVIKRHLEV